MRRIVPSLALAVALLYLPGIPAAASPHVFAGIDFAVADVGFSLGFADLGHRRGRGRGHDDHDGGYYYRTRVPLTSREHRCSDACYLRDDVYYHHPECPVVLQHFDRYGFDPYPVWTALPDDGLFYYPYAHGPEFHDDHHGRRHGGGHGGRRGRRHDDGDSDSDSDSHRRRGGRGWHDD
ncbi:MAG: hypothetical protein OES32_04695 [Acidobacteriota bacterium]|nr:hypothetical protein [Acidobacteriota bacterium]MDH3522864.1 hypothetical protein [Acidobacteriota bacterium]